MINRKPKYKNKRIPKAWDGIGWDSMAERDYYYRVLRPNEMAGLISDVVCHRSVQLTPHVKWKVDFTFFDVVVGRQVWEEYKGVETADFRVKRDLWRTHGPGELHIVKGSGLRFKIVDIIIPKREAG